MWLEFMKLDINSIIAICLISCSSHSVSAGGLRETVLRDAAVRAGLVRPEETHVPAESDLVAVGQLLFESRLLSSNRDVACASCHIDKFGSADGIPNAIGTKGQGVGAERISNGGDIVPRNALPFWGRGGLGFDVFFWDGRVDGSNSEIVSQFGDQVPSDDPLVVAVHLPPVEIGEMVDDHETSLALQTEDVSTATRHYEELALRIQNDPELGPLLARARSIQESSIEFVDIAEAIAAFIRVNFRLKQTKFHEFVFDGGDLNPQELEGGLLFYGRGRCASCHNGPYFSDMNFYSMPFPQLGFGPNGFGVDYGRFNVTLNYSDTSLFRTPPLYNVTKTAPYSHSGSIVLLSDVIRIHTDPLSVIDFGEMDLNDRVQFYERLAKWSQTSLNGVVLSDKDFTSLEAFLATLSYESDADVEIVD
jgi:cytochrome c peroxidase